MANGALIHARFLFLSVACESTDGTGRSAEGGVLEEAGGITLCLGVFPIVFFCARLLGLSVGWGSCDGTGSSDLKLRYTS